jgi:mitochondrial fission protein ELM1
MKPSLPTALFDLCLIPEHDGVAPSERVVTTRGVLNVVRPSQAHDPGQGLLLVGGPSSAHDWSDEQMLQQIQTILSSDPDLRWQLTTSRRTPASFVAQLANCQLPNLKVTPHQQTSPDWLPQQLARAGQVWVSEDSVSMVYEALTSGAAVGILQVPTTRQRSRVATGVAALLRNQWATRFADWQPGTPLTTPPEQLDEARRCAQTICQKLAAA